jgi:hypothetical protein
VVVRIDRKRKLPVTVLLRAMGDTLREGGYVPEGWTGADEAAKPSAREDLESSRTPYPLATAPARPLPRG